jgi:hypothetical protein
MSRFHNLSIVTRTGKIPKKWRRKLLTSRRLNVNEKWLEKVERRGKTTIRGGDSTLYTFTHQDLPSQAPREQDNHNPAECLRLLAQLMLNHQFALGEEDLA